MKVILFACFLIAATAEPAATTAAPTVLCSPTTPCASGGGDCDTNADCQGALVCVPSSDGLLSGGGMNDFCGTSANAAAAAAASGNSCECKKQWNTSDGGNCSELQSGCPTSACDDGSSKSWCSVANLGCAEEEDNDGWAYCTDGITPVQETQFACECKKEWTSASDGGNCSEVQSGCPTAACEDGSSESWCSVANPGCDEEEDNDGWAYCTDGITPVQETQFACECKKEWTSASDGGICSEVQSGCPSAACENGAVESWCSVSNPGCAEEEDGEGWAYCTPDIFACECKNQWNTTDKGGNCSEVQSGCPSAACNDGSSDSWCEVANPGCAEEETKWFGKGARSFLKGDGWAYCNGSTPVRSDDITTTAPIGCDDRCAEGTSCVDGKCTAECPSSNECCSGTMCGDSTYTVCVGEFDSFCETNWDQQCRSEAITECGLDC